MSRDLVSIGVSWLMSTFVMTEPLGFAQRDVCLRAIPMRRFGVLLFLLGLAVPGFGQSNYAVLTGIVTDSQHLPVVGAAVKLTAASTGAIRRVVTNQHGLFEAPALLPDDYELRVEASGLATAKQSLRLEVGQKLAVDITLRVGSVTEGVEV